MTPSEELPLPTVMRSDFSNLTVGNAGALPCRSDGNADFCRETSIFAMQMVAMQFHDADEQKLHYSDCNAEFCIAHDADSSASQLHRILS